MSGHQQPRTLSQVGSTDLVPVLAGEGGELPRSTLTEVHVWHPSPVLSWFLFVVFGLLLVVVLVLGLVKGWPTLLLIAPYVFFSFLALLSTFALVHLATTTRHQATMKRLHERSAELDVLAKADERRRANELHETMRYLATWRLPADELGNRPFPFNPSTGVYIPIPSGNYSQPVPHTLHYDYRGTSTRVTEEPPPPAVLPPVVLTGAALLSDGTVERALSSGYYLLGPSDDGKMKQIACKRLFSTIVAGVPRVGKTTTVFWIVVQVLINLGKFFVVDPNMFYESEDGDRGLASELAALADFMIFPPCEGKRSDLRVRLLFMYETLKLRKQPGHIVKNSDTILCVIDEFNTCATRMDTDEVIVTDEEEGELTLLGLLALLEREGPKYGLVFLLIGHKWTKQDIGDNAIRTNATTYMCHKMNDEGQAKLLMSGSHARKVLELPVGAYLASGPQFEQNATKIYTPMISARDIPMILTVIARVGGSMRSSPHHGPDISTPCPQSPATEESGYDVEQPRRPSDTPRAEPELSADLRAKMLVVLQLDQQPGISVNDILKQVWNVEASTRAGRAAKEELQVIRGAIAKQVSSSLRKGA
jgi:hypothetical protein